VRTEVEEDEIKIGLLGSEKEKEDAIHRAYFRYRRPIAAFIRERVAPTLDSDEMATVISATFCGFALYVDRGKFNPDGSLSTLLFTIARRKAIDQLRRRKKLQMAETWDQSYLDEPTDNESTAENDDEIFRSGVAQALRECPEIGALWRTAADEGSANEIIRQFRIWIGTQPRLQRKVGEALLRHSGDVTNAQIAAEIATPDDRPTVASVKSARNEITRKFKTLMTQKERNTRP
jgi:DNA-directed RNA polymerase specialized sigma24 family protein